MQQPLDKLRVGRITGCLLLLMALFVSVGEGTPLFAQADGGEIIDNPDQLAPGEVLRVENGEVRQIAFAPDESVLAVATSAGLWIYAPDQERNGELLDDTPVRSLWWSVDSSMIAAALDEGSLQIWRISDRQSVGKVDGAAGAVVSVAWSPDQVQLATGTENGVIEIWDVAETTILETLEGHTGAIRALYWTANGSQLVSTADDGAVRVWEVKVSTPPKTPTAVPTPTTVAAQATVQVETLNVRSGPGTTFDRIASAKRGEKLTVLGQSNNCAWLQVRTSSNVQGWVAGGAQFVTLSATCNTISPATAASPPAAEPTKTESQAAPTPTPQAVQPAATATPAPPPPTPTPEPAADQLPTDQGCYLFQNQLGPELTVTLTNLETGVSEDFKVPNDQEVPRCLAPGRYSYTIDAPPPWANINGELSVNAGDRFFFPIRPRE